MFEIFKKLTATIAILGSILGLSTFTATQVALGDAFLLNYQFLNKRDGFQLLENDLSTPFANTGLYLDPKITEGCSYDQVVGGSCAALIPYTNAGLSFTHMSTFEIGYIFDNAQTSTYSYSAIVPSGPSTFSLSESLESENYFDNMLVAGDALGDFTFDFPGNTQGWWGITADPDPLGSPNKHVVYRIEKQFVGATGIIMATNTTFDDATAQLFSGHWLRLVESETDPGPDPASEPAMIGLFGLGAISLLALRRRK